MINPGLPDNYAIKCVNRWRPLLESADIFGDINSESKLKNTAMVLENTMKEFEVKAGAKGNKALLESVSATTGGGVGGSSVFAASDGYASATDDARLPNVVIPAIRRAFPNLIAHDIVGVQPMAGPIGFAFAIRALYGPNGKGSIDEGSELGFNFVDSAHSGATGSYTADAGDAASAWLAFNGSGGTTASGDVDPVVLNAAGDGAGTADAEWWKFNTTMPMVSFKMLKATITAKTRKLGANWSQELEEDMKAMQGLDVRAEFVNMVSYELQQEIDRQILGNIVKAALDAGNVSTWTPVTADGRTQQERIATLYTEMIRRANDVAVKSRRGAANFAFASPTVCSLFAATAFNPLSVVGLKADPKGLLTQNGVSKVGTFVNNGITLYRDTFAQGDYLCLGYKGQSQYDSGVIYCPYIPMQLKEVIGTDDLNPRMMVRTRYGMTENLLASGNYYHMVSVSGLSSALNSDDSGTRKFLV